MSSSPTNAARPPWSLTKYPVTRKARLRAIAWLCLITAGIAVIALRDPRGYGLGVLCPTRRLLGIYCPGCGTTRAAHDLLHWQPASAIANNPLAVFVGLPMLAGLVVNLLFGAIRGVSWRVQLPTYAGAVAASVLVLYALARNIPIDAFDSLRPPPYRLLPEVVKPANG